MGIDSGPGNVKPGPNLNFGRHASRNSAGLNWWNKFDKDLRTPPPPTFPPRGSSMGGDINMDSPAESVMANGRDGSVVSTIDPIADEPPASAVTSDFAKKFGKRRREDDFDIASIKRRAVSPSLSVHNSPIVSQSPGQRDTTGWGQPPKHTRENSTAGTIEPVRSNSGGSSTSLASTATLGPKRVGLQGMTDTNDGLMKMSIE